jgi:hypothetical protein
MAEQQLSAEAASIDSMTRWTESSLRAAAAATDTKSIPILGVAAILAALPQVMLADPNQLENMLRLFPGFEFASNQAGSMRFVEFVRSLSIWVNATEPEAPVD